MERPHNPHTYINRRKFLRLSGILGAGLAVGGILPVSAEAVKFNTDEYKVDETRSAMSTTVTMILIHPSKTEAQEAIGRAFEEIYRLEGLMNRFDDSTAVGSLNRQGSLIGIPSEVLEVIRSSLRYHGVTGGNFDITVKPVIELFSCASQGKSRYPDKREIEEAFDLWAPPRSRLTAETSVSGNQAWALPLTELQRVISWTGHPPFFHATTSAII